MVAADCITLHCNHTPKSVYVGEAPLEAINQLPQFKVSVSIQLFPEPGNKPIVRRVASEGASSYWAV